MIVVRFVLTEKFGEMEDNKLRGRIRRARKAVVGVVHYVAGKKKFWIRFKDVQKKYISYCSLTLISS